MTWIQLWEKVLFVTAGPEIRASTVSQAPNSFLSASFIQLLKLDHDHVSFRCRLEDNSVESLPRLLSSSVLHFPRRSERPLCSAIASPGAVWVVYYIFYLRLKLRPKLRPAYFHCALYTLVSSGWMSAGSYQLNWNSHGVGTGVSSAILKSFPFQRQRLVAPPPSST